MKKRIILIIPLFFLFLIAVIFSEKNKSKDEIFEITFNNDIGYISIYNASSSNIKLIKNEINDLLTKYEKLLDRYNAYDNIINLYTIKTNKDNISYLEIDELLYKMLEKAKKLEQESDGFYSASNGNLYDLWKSYQNQSSVLPSTLELNLAKNSEADIILLGSNKIKNNHPNINLDSIADAYIVEELSTLIKKYKIESFTIHLGDVIKVGKKYSDNPYQIGIEDPLDKTKIVSVVSLENKSLISIGSNSKINKYQDKSLYWFIPGNALKPLDTNSSFSLVGSEAIETKILAYKIYASGDTNINNYSDFQIIKY